MGRKPNQLVLSNFIRGPKLSNSTNRYAQTCRACGQEFPKGRTESLTKHALKECPAAPVDGHAQILSDLTPPSTSPDDPTIMALAIHHPSPAHPFASKQSMSALEALAEVSRQHLDFSSTRAPPQHARLPSPNGYSPDDFLVSDEKAPAEDEVNLTSGNLPNSASFGILPPIQFNGNLTSHDSPRLPSLVFSALPAPSTNVVPSPLQLAASAANELLIPNGGNATEPDHATNGHTHDRPLSPPRSNTDWSLDPLLQSTSTSSPPQLDHTSNRPTQFRRLAINPSVSGSPQPPELGVEHRSPKPKVRGRFTDSRRKEVQEVRKRGACIRCRMLKKPCSDGTPCTTCRNVESARLWKQPCIRTRVAEEFDLYNAGLHAVLSFHQTNQIKATKPFRSVDRKIVASHFPNFSVSATFASLESANSQHAEQELHAKGNPADANVGMEASCMIDTAAGLDLVGEVQSYMQRLIPNITASEPSQFIRITLQEASAMNSGDKQDNLISNALELWTATAILTDPQLQLYLAYTPPNSARSEGDSSGAQETESAPISDHESISCIEMQLNSIIEKRAAVCAKFVMNELERRLLQRQQANPFETFLVAILLITCTERMCWLFKTWEVISSYLPAHHDPSTTPPELANSHALSQVSCPPSDPLSPLTPATPTNISMGNVPDSPTLPLDHAALPPSPRWPLDKPPQHYYLKGERFSDIVQMLLRMRGVPPKVMTQVTFGGTASGLSRAGEHVLQAFGIAASAPSDIGAASGHGNVDGSNAAPQQAWLDKLGISVEELQRRRVKLWEREDVRSWEGKFIAKILRIT